MTHRSHLSWLKMITACFYTIVALNVMLFRVAEGGAGQDEYYNLVNELFSGYDKNVRPTTEGEFTIVNINLLLKSIVTLDEKNQVLETYASLHMSWNDDYLGWNSTDNANITRILYPQKQLWLPDIVNENSVESQVQLGYDQLKCSIVSDGTVTWVPSEIFKTSCDIDVTYYPFDTQTCSLIFTTMMSTIHEIDIDPYAINGNLDLTDYSESATWELVSTSIQTPNYNDNYTRIVFKIKLKRLRLYYVANILLPVLLLSTVSSMVFYLPADSGEKIGMSITVLLSYTVYLTIIAEKMPETSQQMSMLGIYIIFLISLSCMSVILSVVVLNISHRDPEIPITRETEQWTRAWRRNIGLGAPNSPPRRNKIEPSRRNIPDGLRMRRDQTKDSLDDALAADLSNHKSNVNRGYEVDTASSIEEEITWPKVAQTVDRLLFIGFSLFTILITVVILPLMAILGEFTS